VVHLAAMVSFLASSFSWLESSFHWMLMAADFPAHHGKRSRSGVGVVRATQQSLEAAPIPAGYQTVIWEFRYSLRF
jgi:hypothetical protein